jgi:hypothetical protein
VIFDATVMSDSPWTTFGSEPTLRVGYNGYPGYGRQRTLIRFDISALPADAEIDTAHLGFCCTGGTADEPMTVSVHEIMCAWRESEVTWENCAECKGPALAAQSLPAVTGDGYWVIWSGAAMAQAVEEWVRQGHGFGFMLIGDEDETPSVRLRTLASRESSLTWCRPYLRVTWHPGETPTPWRLWLPLASRR